MILYYNIVYIEINIELKKIQFCQQIQVLKILSSLCSALHIVIRQVITFKLALIYQVSRASQAAKAFTQSSLGLQGSLGFFLVAPKFGSQLLCCHVRKFLSLMASGLPACLGSGVVHCSPRKIQSHSTPSQLYFIQCVAARTQQSVFLPAFSQI